MRRVVAEHCVTQANLFQKVDSSGKKDLGVDQVIDRVQVRSLKIVKLSLQWVDTVTDK